MSAPDISRRTAAFTLASLAAAIQTPGFARELTKVRVATSPIDVAAQAYFALDRGFFRQAGLDVELTSLRPPAILPAVIGGAVDIGSGSSIGLFAAKERDVPFVMIAEAGMYSSKFPSAAIIVAKTSPYASAADLNGKIFGTDSLKNLGTLGAMAWADRNGGDFKSYKFIELSSAEQGIAVEARRIDAGAILEPYLSQAISGGNIRILSRPFDSIAPEFCEGGWFCMSDYAKSNPDVVKRFSGVMDQSAKWANRNPDLAAAVLQRYSRAMPTPAAYRTVFPERFDPAKLQVVIDSAAHFGILSKSHMVTDIIPPSLLTG